MSAPSQQQKAYELGCESAPLRVPDPASIRTQPPKANPRPLAPTNVEMEPQPNVLDKPFANQPGSTNASGGERVRGAGGSGGFQAAIAANETSGPSYKIAEFIPNPPEATSSPSWLAGQVLGPAVPRWEEQPERGADAKLVTNLKNLPTVSPTASSY